MTGKNKNGFTLIETIVALAVFGFVASIAVNSFVGILDAQRKALALQEAQNELRYALEIMSREIRMSHINPASTENLLFVTAFKENGSTEDVYYVLSASVPKSILRSGWRLTLSDKVAVNKMKFYINEENDPPAIVTIAVQAETTGKYAGQKINLETTITARDYVD